MKQVAVAVDQLLNTLLGGWADETISARLYRSRHNSWWWAFWYRAVNRVFFWQEDHCRRAFDSEVLRRQFPKAYRI